MYTEILANLQANAPVITLMMIGFWRLDRRVGSIETKLFGEVRD